MTKRRPREFHRFTIDDSVSVKTLNLSNLRQSAKAGNLDDACLLGFALTRIGIENEQRRKSSWTEAQRVLWAAVHEGSVSAAGILGNLLVDCNLDLPEGERLLRVGAEAGDPRSMRDLAAALRMHQLAERHPGEHMSWLLKAEEAGDPIAAALIELEPAIGSLQAVESDGGADGQTRSEPGERDRATRAIIDQLNSEHGSSDKEADMLSAPDGRAWSLERAFPSDTSVRLLACDIAEPEPWGAAGEDEFVVEVENTGGRSCWVTLDIVFRDESGKLCRRATLFADDLAPGSRACESTTVHVPKRAVSATLMGKVETS